MKMRLRDKVAVITGAASGFGKGIAELFVNEGAKIVVADLNGEGARSVAENIGDQAVAVQCDVARKADVQSMIETAVSSFGGLDILVNNAGATHKNKSLLDVTEEEFDRIYDVNVKSIYLSTLAVVPVFKKSGGWCDHQYGIDGRIEAETGTDLVQFVERCGHDHDQIHGG